MRRKSDSQKNSPSGIICSAPWRVVSLKILSGYCFEVTFNDGTKGRVDISQLVNSQSAGVFQVLRDESVFKRAEIRHGVVTWPGDIDLAPDAMYDEIKLTGRWIVPER